MTWSSFPTTNKWVLFYKCSGINKLFMKLDFDYTRLLFRYCCLTVEIQRFILKYENQTLKTMENYNFLALKKIVNWNLKEKFWIWNIFLTKYKPFKCRTLKKPIRRSVLSLETPHLMCGVSIERALLRIGFLLQNRSSALKGLISSWNECH